MGDGRERAAGKAYVQRALSGLNEAVECGIDGSVIAIVRSTVIGRSSCDLTGSDDSFSQVVIYVGVDASQRELDARDCRLAAAVKQDLPASGRGLTEERGFERREIERCELHVELGKPGRIGESTGGAPALGRPALPEGTAN